MDADKLLGPYCGGLVGCVPTFHESFEVMLGYRDRNTPYLLQSGVVSSVVLLDLYICICAFVFLSYGAMCVGVLEGLDLLQQNGLAYLLFQPQQTVLDEPQTRHRRRARGQ